MHDLYRLIEKIKKAPSMYLGRHSIICLQAFLSGYSVAKYELGEQPTKQDSDFMEFPEWIRKRFNVQTSQSWANIILFYSEDESKALDKFFELLDEFINRNPAADNLGKGGLDVEEKVEVFRS
ncbi:hypothetical protein [Kamptonema sp. UHCC 0994]|uniref:hypothetical protein n=1 Tax=Kamptonema sp. UHCC 0994 TaxID=3031329 RepID=UPI0023BA0056|nr:hypothetical protein [Kamptonema sp. UHCC 0994]MDF0553080.1 hypothetical protein [Kamptonema sp. UHCC 0994]